MTEVFDVYFSSDQNNFVNLSAHSTIFAPSLIGKSLRIFTHKEALGIKSAIAGWLINQRKDNVWSFNYWDKASPMYIQRSYPDDSDDTFCALSVLYDFNPDIFTGKAMAGIANILFSAEANEGGPYRTWLVAQSGQPDWQSIDPAVNANVAAFLWKQEVALPKVVNFLEQSILDN